MTAKRQTAAEKATAARLRDLKHLAELSVARPARPSESSVSVTRNAKGQYQWSVEVSNVDASAACDVAEAIAKRLDAAFPFDNGTAES